jgi:hypothetical protein
MSVGAFASTCASSGRSCAATRSTTRTTGSRGRSVSAPRPRLHRPDPPIPIYVAANARACSRYGEIATATSRWGTSGHACLPTPRGDPRRRHQGGSGSADGFHTTALTTAVVLQPGERADSTGSSSNADRRSRPACTSRTKRVGDARRRRRPARMRLCGRSTPTTLPQ